MQFQKNKIIQLFTKTAFFKLTEKKVSKSAKRVLKMQKATVKPWYIQPAEDLFSLLYTWDVNPKYPKQYLFKQLIPNKTSYYKH